jgi:hypothetical protein
MPELEGNGGRGSQPGGPISSKTALRSTKAGLWAVFLASFALATFGPWFNLTLGYTLMIASFVAACFGVGWADRASHEGKRNPAIANGIYAKSGAALSILALLVSAYYSGLFVFLVVFAPLWMIVGLLLYALHRSIVDTAARKGVGA